MRLLTQKEVAPQPTVCQQLTCKHRSKLLRHVCWQRLLLLILLLPLLLLLLTLLHLLPLLLVLLRQRGQLSSELK